MRSPRLGISSPPANFTTQNKNKNFDNKNKKNQDLKKSLPKKSTLRPIEDDFNKSDAKKF